MGGKRELTVVLVSVCISLAKKKGGQYSKTELSPTHRAKWNCWRNVCRFKKKIQLLELELGQNTFTNTSIHEKGKKKVSLMTTNDHRLCFSSLTKASIFSSVTFPRAGWIKGEICHWFFFPPKKLVILFALIWTVQRFSKRESVLFNVEANSVQNLRCLTAFVCRGNQDLLLLKWYSWKAS